MNSAVKPQFKNQPLKPMLIILMGNAFEGIANQIGDFDEWIQNALSDMEVEVINPKTHMLPNPLHYSGIILTGSHAMVTDQEVWSQEVSDWLYICRRLDVSILGICYGHQLIAQTFGGWVENNPKGLEIGTHLINLNENVKEDILFNGLPQKISAHLVHYQSVIQLPKGATLLASNQHDKHQAYRLGKYIWGVQFHPEFTEESMQGYIDNVLEDESLKDKMKLNMKNTKFSQQLLINFQNYCIQRHNNLAYTVSN